MTSKIRTVSFFPQSPRRTQRTAFHDRLHKPRVNSPLPGFLLRVREHFVTCVDSYEIVASACQLFHEGAVAASDLEKGLDRDLCKATGGLLQSVYLPRNIAERECDLLTSIRKKQQRGDAIKPSETGCYRRIEGRSFPSRPVTWCILVIRRLIAFIYNHIFEFTSPKTYESRLILEELVDAIQGFALSCVLPDMYVSSQCFSPGHSRY